MKTNMKLVISFIFVLFITISIFIFSINIKQNNNKNTSLSNKQNMIVENVLNNINDENLKNEIIKNIKTNILYDELKQIHNNQYGSMLGKFIVSANDTLKNNSTSFMDKYNDGMSIKNILYSTCGTDFMKFTNTYFIGDDTNKEYDLDNSDTLYLSYINDINQDKKDVVLKNINNLLKTYKFTSNNNLKIANIYHDLNILEKDEINVDILDKLYDSTIYSICVLSLDNKTQQNLIYDKNFKQISNIKNCTITDIKFNSVSIMDSNYKDLYKKIFDTYSSSTDDPLYELTIFEISLTNNKNNYTIYGIITTDKICHIYSIL